MLQYMCIPRHTYPAAPQPVVDPHTEAHSGSTDYELRLSSTPTRGEGQ